MHALRRLRLTLQANIERYEVTVCDGENVWKKRVSTRRDCLCVCTRSPCLRVVCRSLTGGYSSSLFFWLDVRCEDFYSLYLSFPQNSTPSAALNRFTLTDSTYGLPIDGSLFFRGN